MTSYLLLLFSSEATPLDKESIKIVGHSSYANRDAIL